MSYQYYCIKYKRKEHRKRDVSSVPYINLANTPIMNPSTETHLPSLEIKYAWYVIPLTDQFQTRFFPDLNSYDFVSKHPD